MGKTAVSQDSENGGAAIEVLACLKEEDYTKVSLTYFADGILADECGEIVDDVEEIIGDGLDHFGEYEDDSVFVRSDAKRCDYEILKDLRDFSDFKKKNFPPNNDEEV